MSIVGYKPNEHGHFTIAFSFTDVDGSKKTGKYTSYAKTDIDALMEAHKTLLVVSMPDFQMQIVKRTVYARK